MAAGLIKYCYLSQINPLATQSMREVKHKGQNIKNKFIILLGSIQNSIKIWTNCAGTPFNDLGFCSRLLAGKPWNNECLVSVYLELQKLLTFTSMTQNIKYQPWMGRVKQGWRKVSEHRIKCKTAVGLHVTMSKDKTLQSAVKLTKIRIVLS